MAANTTPIFPLTPTNSFIVLTSINATAFNNHNGVGATYLCSGATNGTRIDTIFVNALGSNNASVLRLFLNNGSTNTTSANNCLISESTLAATTISEIAALSGFSISLGLLLQSGYKLYAGLGTTASAGWGISSFGGDY